MMKKFLTFLLLGLMVFAVSCGGSEDAFKANIMGRSGTFTLATIPTGLFQDYPDGSSFTATFSTDGSTLTIANETWSFRHASNENTATYELNGLLSNIITVYMDTSSQLTFSGGISAKVSLHN